MPSPFPGMDLYLEGSLWGSVHTQLSVEIARQLTPRLLPKYVALTEKRFVVAVADAAETPSTPGMARSRYPNAGVVRGRGAAGGPAASGPAMAPPPLRLVTVMPEAVPHVTVEIVEAGSRRLVTAIEVLSPTNKRGDGREEYLRRRRPYLLSDVHLMEIDLLRTGERVPMRQPLPSVPYFVLVSRAETRPVTEVLADTAGLAVTGGAGAITIGRCGRTAGFAGRAGGRVRRVRVRDAGRLSRRARTVPRRRSDRLGAGYAARRGSAVMNGESHVE